jgi:hypothetical protein
MVTSTSIITNTASSLKHNSFTGEYTTKNKIKRCFYRLDFHTGNGRIFFLTYLKIVHSTEPNHVFRMTGFK